jgi:glycosyltransferase involved in cell wall biosynthesis
MLRLLQRRYVLWTDTPQLLRKRSGTRKALRAVWLKWVFSGAERLMSTGSPGVEALRSMGAPPARVLSFPFWVDLRAFKPAETARRPEAGPRCMIFVSSGRLQCSVKGQDLALRALALAMRTGHVDWRYRIAGSGPDLEALKSLSAELAITHHVEFLGWVEHDRLVTVYRDADCMIHPSPIHDPFPNAVLEGMAAGLAVFASDACGSALDRIQHGVNGFIHPAGQWEVLAQQIEQCFRSGDLLSQARANARTTAERWPVTIGVGIIETIASEAASTLPVQRR